MTYTKLPGKHDKVTIDGTDVSNSFFDFGVESVHADEDVSAFSAAGTDELIAGSTAQAFVGVARYTEALAAIVQPAHANRTQVVITWQPYGLVDATREIYSGTCTIMEWSPRTTRPTSPTTPFRAVPDVNGITVGNFT